LLDQSEILKMDGFLSADGAPTSESLEEMRLSPLSDVPLAYEEQDACELAGGVEYWRPDVKKPQADNPHSLPCPWQEAKQFFQRMAKAKPKSPIAKAEAKAKPKTKGKAKPKAMSKAKAKPKTKAKAKAKPKPVKAKAKLKPKQVSKAKPKPVSKAKAKPKTKAIPWTNCAFWHNKRPCFVHNGILMSY
jgi:hypothetical protein